MVVVLGRDAAAVVSALRADEPAALDQVLVIVNPEPERGLATSLAIMAEVVAERYGGSGVPMRALAPAAATA